MGTADDDDDDDDDTAPDDDDDDTGDDDTSVGSPAIAVTPLPVLIDPAVVGTLAPGTFTIWNEGTAILDVSEVSLLNDAGGILSVVSWAGYINAGESEEVTNSIAAFCNVAGQQDGIMTISSNDPTTPALSVVVQVVCTDPA